MRSSATPSSQERLALGGQILPVGGTARVSDERCRHWSARQCAARKHAGLTVEPELLAHISPLGWAHILLTGEIPVAKTPIAALAYDSAPYRNRPRPCSRNEYCVNRSGYQ